MQGFISSIGNIESGGQGGEGDSFVKLIVDLTGITPTTETLNNKEYNKFTFNKTNLTFKTITQLGDEEAVAVDDALIYKLFPISNNNDDKGVYISYDGDNFSGYVLAEESTLTTVTFMFSYYLILTQTSVVWQNYIDLVFSGGSGSYLLETLIEPYPALLDAKKMLLRNLLSDGGGLSISGYDDGGNYISISSTTYSSSDLMNIITSSYSAASATKTDYITVNTGNKYINLLYARLSSGGATVTVTWYNGDTVITTAQYALSNSNFYHEFVAPNARCNKARIEIYRYQKSLNEFQIRVYATITCKANNIDIPGLVYGNLQAFPLPDDGINNIRTINSTIYENYDTNYQTGLNLITYDGSNLHYYNSTTTNV